MLTRPSLNFTHVSINPMLNCGENNLSKFVLMLSRCANKLKQPIRTNSSGDFCPKKSYTQWKEIMIEIALPSLLVARVYQGPWFKASWTYGVQKAAPMIYYVTSWELKFQWTPSSYGYMYRPIIIGWWKDVFHASRQSGSQWPPVHYSPFYSNLNLNLDPANSYHTHHG